jgi:hypothetical protein
MEHNDNDKKVKRLELTDELVNKYGILDVNYNSEKIEINFTNVDGQNDTMALTVQQYPSETINQLDLAVNCAMSLDAFTRLKHYMSLKFPPMWNQVYRNNKKRDEERDSKK